MGIQSVRRLPPADEQIASQAGEPYPLVFTWLLVSRRTTALRLYPVLKLFHDAMHTPLKDKLRLSLDYPAVV